MKLDILLVEDELSIAEPLAYLLESEGHTVTVVTHGDDALPQFRSQTPDLILLDLLLPGMSGLEICKVVRAESRTPIIILSAKSAELDRILGLELGADDYVTKPYSSRELLARIKSVMRRYSEPENNEPDILRYENLILDLSRHALMVNGQEVSLPRKEFEVLELLMSNPGRVLPRERLISLVWGSDYFGDTKTLDVHIKRLRDKVEAVPGQPTIIQTVRGVGYRLG